MERETRTLRAFRPSQYSPDVEGVPAIRADQSYEEREAIILLYAARARSGLPLFQEQQEDSMQSGAA